VIPTYAVVPVASIMDDMPDWVETFAEWGASDVFVIGNDDDELNLSAKWNTGLDRAEVAARSAGLSEWNVLVLNDDIEFQDDFLGLLAEALRSAPDIAVACPNWQRKLEIPDGALVDVARFGPPAMAGWCFMVRGEQGLRADPRFRWWYGDDDIRLQVLGSGRRLVVVGACRVGHLRGGESTTASPELQALAERDGAAFRAKWAL
jgi:hypothetical protein